MIETNKSGEHNFRVFLNKLKSRVRTCKTEEEIYRTVVSAGSMHKKILPGFHLLNRGNLEPFLPESPEIRKKPFSFLNLRFTNLKAWKKNTNPWEIAFQQNSAQLCKGNELFPHNSLIKDVPAAAVPLIFNKNVIGVLGMVHPGLSINDSIRDLENFALMLLLKIIELRNESSSSFLRFSYTNSPLANVWFDRHGAVVFFNHSFKQIIDQLELQPENLMISDLDSYLKKTDPADFWQELLNRKSLKCDLTILNLNHSKNLYQGYYFIHTLMEEPYCCCFYRDISTRQRYKKNKIFLEEQLKQAQKMEAMGALAGGIAHDFNNVLGSIIGFTELTLDTMEPDTNSASNLRNVLLAAERAREMIKKILVFARKQEQEQKPVRIALAVEESLKLLRFTLPTSIDIQTRIQATASVVMMEPTAIQQILMNLGTNAAHAMSENGGVLTVQIEDTVVDHSGSSAMPPGEYVRLTVRDTGSGIPADIANRIFEPYFTTKSKDQGTGMGLAVIQQIVEDHKGSVMVKSAPGMGATFTIHLPKVKMPETDDVKKSAVVPRGNERIMFIDDEESLVILAEKMLGKLGYQVRAFSKNMEALEVFRRNPRAFDLVISDMNMPGMNGLELGRELRWIRKDIKVIISTGFSDRLTPEKLEESGIHGVIMKPISLNDFAVSIRRALDSDKA